MFIYVVIKILCIHCKLQFSLAM